MENDFFIKSNYVYIPQMEVRSSAVDLSVNGKHSFDNDYEYHVKVLLSEILSRQRNKNKSNVTEFGEVQDDGLGRTMIHLTMKGPAADPKFTWNRKGVEQKITDEIRNESKTLKTLLKEEFGKKDTSTSKSQPKKKTEELQIEYEEDTEQ
jgi:hypothetical protein